MFKSIAQEHFLFSQHPEIAKNWRAEHPNQNLQKLPQHAQNMTRLGATKPTKPINFSPWQGMKK